MKLQNIMRLAESGRPDLAAKNIGATGCGAWRHPVRLLRVLTRYPHSDGTRLSIRDLACSWRAGREDRDMPF